MTNAVQTLPKALIVFQRDQTKLTFAKRRYKPDLSEVSYPINQATVMCKDLYFYMNSCFYQFGVQYKQMVQRQLFAEFKVTKGELQLCETPLTHYHLSSAPFINKGQVHHSLLEEKKILKKAMAA